MIKNNLKKIQLFISIIFLIFFVLAFLFLYRKINQNNQKAEDYMVQRANEANQRDEIQSLDKSIEMIKEDKAMLETHFAKSSDIVPFLDTIEASATKAGIKAEVASVDVLSKTTVLTVKVNALGGFAGIYKFIELLENFPYQLDFTSFNMQANNVTDATGKNTKQVNWQTSFTIRLLSFVP